LEFNAVPSEKGETDATTVVAVEPKERFSGAFEVTLLPSEKTNNYNYKLSVLFYFTIVNKNEPDLEVVVGKVVVLPNCIVEAVEAPTFPNEENGVFVIGLLLVEPRLPKLVVDAAVDDAGHPPTVVPKPNCGLLK